MKKYVIVLSNGSKQYAFSEKTYKVGDWYGMIGLVLEVL